MQFVIDKISEDSFYGNMLLGLPETLLSLGIQDTYIARKQGVPESDIIQWEFKNGIRLAEDMRNFYAATDGFLYTWQLAEPEEHGNSEGVVVSGKIEVNPISQFTHLSGLLEYHLKATTSGGGHDLKLGVESKVFELCKVDDLGRVVVVYVNSHSVPRIWLCTSTIDFFHLADDFTTYVRMAVVHLGIPEWQFAFTPKGVSEAGLELFQVLAPHLLPFNNKSQPVEVKSEEDGDGPLNEIESDHLLYPKIHTNAPSNPVIDFGTPRKQDKKKGAFKYRPPTKVKRKPLYYVKH